MVIDILEHYEPETLRFLFFPPLPQSEPLDFSDEGWRKRNAACPLKTAQENLQALMALMNAGPTEKAWYEESFGTAQRVYGSHA